MAIVPRRHPVIAGVLGVVVVGLGHMYLRRWVRGVGWAALAIAVGILLVPQEQLAALNAASETVSLSAVAPALAVVVGSTIDAVRLAVGDDTAEQTDEITCPSCGESVDPDLDFCQWCSADLTANEE